MQLMMMIIDLQITCDPFINCVSGRLIIKFMLTIIPEYITMQACPLGVKLDKNNT